MSKTCKNCGEEIKDTARICPKCGKPADPPEQPYLNRKVKKTPWIDGTDSKTADKEKKKPHIGIIIAAILFVAVIAAGMYWLAERSPQENGINGEASPTEAATAAVTSDTPDPALKKLADEGRIASKLSAVDSDKMKSMIADAKTLEYTEMGEREFAEKVYGITGCRLSSADSSLSEITAENDSFFFADAGDDEEEAYLAFDKKEKTMFILVYLPDGYWMCEKVANENIVARYSGEEQNNTEVHYVLEETGETVFFGKTVDDIWCFYYNGSGELFLCMDNTDISDPKFFNGDFLSMESFAGRLSLQTVLDSITAEYGKELKF